jgi:chromosome segregation ATPase
MHDKKDISDILEEVQTIVKALGDEKTELQDQVKGLEAQLILAKEEKTKEGGNLEQINAQLKKELQDTKDRLTRELQETKARLSSELQDAQQKLDRFHPELQSLQNEFQNAEFQNNLLEMELLKKNEEIKTLKDSLSSYTSLASASSSVGEPIA